MKQTSKIVITIVIILVVLYGGYRVVKHFQRLNNPAMQPTSTMNTTPPPSGTMTETTTPGAMTENSVYKTMTNATVGTYLADPKGMTLYTYTKDADNTSNCTGQCLVIWPAYTASSKTGSYPAGVGVITRSDGSLQYTYKGMPLYYYEKDTAPGDVNGQNVGGVWFVAK